MVKVVPLLIQVAPKQNSTMATGPELQTSLEKALSELGYSGKVAKLPYSVAGNEKMVNFVSWLVRNLTLDNHLTTSELEK